MGTVNRFQEYILNSKKILRTFNNPLKRIENVDKKDTLERKFYNEEALSYLEDFDEELFRYDPDEKFPQTHQYFYNYLSNVKGKRILDVGCGYGFTTVKLAKFGAHVTGIDISDKMIELARRNAEFNHVTDLTDIRVMSAQETDFPDESFDYIVGFGALHHLNLDLVGKEFHRLLKPGGEALFIEPRIPFKFLIFVRSLIPTKCFESPGGSQLNEKDVHYFGRLFSEIHIEYFSFLKKFTRFPFLKKYDEKLDAFDTKLVKRFRYLKIFYWAFVLRFVK